MNQKFSAMITIEKASDNFNMPKATVGEMEGEMTTPVAA